MSGTPRAGLVLGLAVATAAVAALPGPLGAPVRRLAAYHADGPDPLWDVPLDGRALRRAGTILPDRTTYVLYAPDARPLLLGNLKAATQLFFTPALPVHGYTQARWVLSYRTQPIVPPGVSPARVIRVGLNVYLVEEA